MKSIAIVGAGICGCTTYLFLKKHLSPHIPDLDIHIYESYPPPAYLSSSRSKAAQSNSSNDGSPEERPNLKPSPSDVTIALGGALGLSPNGFRVFESLDPKIGKRIQDAGVEVDSFAMQLSSGRMLGDFPAGGKRHGHGTVLVMRASLHDAVLERVDGKDITFGKKVRKVVDGEKTVRIEFEDEECLEADLVIGADGVWGETRKAIPECANLKAEYEYVSWVFFTSLIRFRIN
jgi:2-polyprenyl-6-methoxyphenol hydroxylase-like FAD-dependent oxidoreductase